MAITCITEKSIAFYKHNMVVFNEVRVSRAVTLLPEGRMLRYVAAYLNVAPLSIMRLIRRFRETGCYTRRTGRGRNIKQPTTGQVVF